MKHKPCSVFKKSGWPHADKEYERCGNPALWEDEKGNLFCFQCMVLFSQRGVKFKNLEEN